MKLRAVVLAAALLVAAAVARAEGGEGARGRWLGDHQWPRTTIFGFAAAPDGTLWVAAQAGLRHFDGYYTTTRALPWPGGGQPQPFALAADGDGRLFVGLAAPAPDSGIDGLPGAHNTPGLFVVSPDHTQLFTREAGMPDDHVRALAFDGQAMWIGTDAGLLRHEDGRFASVVASDGVSAPVYALAAIAPGHVLVGTGRGAFRVHGDSLVPLASGPATLVNAIAQDGGGRVWLGTPTGVMVLGPSDDDLAARAAQAIGARVVTALLVRDGDVWIATLRGLFVHRVGQGVVAAGADEGIPEDEGVLGLAADAERGVWVATRKRGAVRLWRSPGQLHAAGAASLRPLEAKTVEGGQPIHHDGLGVSWMAAGQDAGVRVWRPGARAIKLTEKNGLPCDTVRGMVEDRQRGFMWLLCPNIVARVALPDVAAMVDGHRDHVQALRYSPSNAGVPLELPSQEPLLASVDEAGRLWFAGNGGVISLDAPPVVQLPGPPRLRYLSGIAAGQEVEVQGTTLSLAGPLGELHVRYRAPVLAVRAGVHIEHRVRRPSEDRPGGWISLLNTQPIVLTHVVPGHYVVEARARNAWGLVSQIETLHIVVAAPVHRRPWFVGVLALALVAGMLGVERTRTWRKRARIVAVEAERKRMARELHDGMGQAFTSIGLHLDLLARHLDPGSAEGKRLLVQTRSVLQHARTHARDAIWNLRQGLDGVPLAQAMKGAVEERQKGLGPNAPRIRFHHEGEAGTGSALADHELLQITQEAITNALKHADARQINVSLRIGGEGTHLDIVDDGRGFALHAERLAYDGHFGILGMKERMRRLEGDLTVSSRSGEGTRIEVVLAKQTNAGTGDD